MRRLLPLLCGLLLAACGQRAARPIGDFTLPVYTPRYASGFEITGAAGSRSTLVTVHNPWYGDEVTDQYLFIARDGEPAPAGFEGQVLRDEARRVVCMSGTYIAMLDALGAADRVVGVSGAQYLINETLRRRIARGEAADVGFDSNVDFERLMALRPDLVMLFGIGGADTALTGKLRELGIPYLYMGEHCEESPLGQERMGGRRRRDRRTPHGGFPPLRRHSRTLRTAACPHPADRPTAARDGLQPLTLSQKSDLLVR